MSGKKTGIAPPACNNYNINFILKVVKYNIFDAKMTQKSTQKFLKTLKLNITAI